MKTKSCKTYRDMAWDTMSSHWKEGIIMMLILILCCCIGSGISLYGAMQNLAQLSMFGTGTSFVVAILLIMPLSFAISQVLMGFVRKSEQQDGASSMFNTFITNYSHLTVTGFLTYLVLVGIGCITLGIGSVIFALAYAMVPFVIMDNPELSPKEVLRKSRMMMRGHKWDLFVLGFSFIGWWLVCMLTCGIGFLWIGPVINTAIAHFYEDIKE